jgi:hypothetical protein
MLEEMLKSDIAEKKPVVDAMVSCGLALHGPMCLPVVSEMVSLDERRKKLGLDAIVACYLTLRGGDGLDLVDERFLKNPNVEYAYVYSTIMALRFHGESTEVLPKPRLLASMRLLLDNPDFADQVIPDLARWEDWSIMDRLVAMFKAGDEKSYVRSPVVTYLTVASEQPGDVGKRAAAALAELERLDPKAVKNAKNMMAFGFLARARAGSGTTSAATRADSKAATQSARAGEKDDTAKAVQAEMASAGFEASAADAKADETVSAKDIPDPASFDSAKQEKQETANATEQPAPIKIDLAAAEPPSPVQRAAEILGPPLQPVVASYSRSLVIGVPLAAMVLLVGLFWAILRRGAV